MKSQQSPKPPAIRGFGNIFYRCTPFYEHVKMVSRLLRMRQRRACYSCPAVNWRHPRLLFLRNIHFGKHDPTKRPIPSLHRAVVSSRKVIHDTWFLPLASTHYIYTLPGGAFSTGSNPFGKLNPAFSLPGEKMVNPLPRQEVPTPICSIFHLFITDAMIYRYAYALYTTYCVTLSRLLSCPEYQLPPTP